MKTPKEIVAKILLGVLAVNIIAIPACTKRYDLDGNRYPTMADNSDTGEILASVADCNLSDKFIAEMQVIENILNDILANKASAEEFCTNPEKYFKKKELAIDIVLTQKDKAIILASTDEDFDQFATAYGL